MMSDPHRHDLEKAEAARRTIRWTAVVIAFFGAFLGGFLLLTSYSNNPGNFYFGLLLLIAAFALGVYGWWGRSNQPPR